MKIVAYIVIGLAVMIGLAILIGRFLGFNNFGDDE